MTEKRPEKATEKSSSGKPTRTAAQEAPGPSTEQTTEEQAGAGSAAARILGYAEQAVEGWAGQLMPRSWGAARSGSTIYVDEWNDAGDWVVDAELPGVDPDRDVTLRLDHHTLELQADRRSPAAEHAASARRELRSGRLVRSLPVPRGADPARASATYHDGILTVRVPLQHEEEPTPRDLTVTRG